MKKNHKKDPLQSRGSFEVVMDKSQANSFSVGDKKEQEVPIPRGNSAYAKAKKAEYLEKNLAKAEKFYRIAIKNGERLESAIKDLATVLHQQGKTDEACKFLEDHRHLCKRNRAKYDNLLLNLRKQIVPSGNFLNRSLILFNVPNNYDEEKIKSLFNNSSRLNEIEFLYDQQVRDILNAYPKDDAPLIINAKACVIRFGSNSAARKTLETLKEPLIYQFYWMNINGELVGKAEAFKKKDEDKKNENQNENDQSIDNDDAGSQGTAESSTMNDSFSQPGGVQDSPCLSFPTEISRSPRVSLELNGDLGLSSAPRSRKISESSDDPSPCWKTCVIFFPKEEGMDPNNNNDTFSPFADLKLPKTSETEKHTESTIRSTSRKPSKFLEGFASENPQSWQARTYLSGFGRAKSEIIGDQRPEDNNINNNNLWQKMKTKQRETKSMLVEDPDYVNKLLAKVIQEDDSNHQTLKHLGSF